MNTVVDNEVFELRTTGRDYDFIAVIINKTDKHLGIKVEEDDCYVTYMVEPDTWLGILADDSGYQAVREIKAGNYEMELLNEDELEDYYAA